MHVHTSAVNDNNNYEQFNYLFNIDKTKHVIEFSAYTHICYYDRSHAR